MNSAFIFGLISATNKLTLASTPSEDLYAPDSTYLDRPSYGGESLSLFGKNLRGTEDMISCACA